MNYIEVYYYFRKYFQKFQYWCYYIQLWTTDMDTSLVVEDCFRSPWPPGPLNGYSPVLLQTLPLILKNCLFPCSIAIFFRKTPLEIKTCFAFFRYFNPSGKGSNAILLQTGRNGIFVKMLINCFTLIQIFIKWFHWMIQFCTENVIFFMLKQFNTSLI